MKKAGDRFPLMEFIIIMAVIGILASIAIPLFMAYRQKGMNPAAGSLADTRGFPALQDSGRIARSVSSENSGDRLIEAAGGKYLGE